MRRRGEVGFATARCVDSFRLRRLLVRLFDQARRNGVNACAMRAELKLRQSRPREDRAAISRPEARARR